MVGGATREMGGARADRGRGGADSAAGGTYSAAGGTCTRATRATGATCAVVTVMVEGMTLGTEGERNGMVTAVAGTNDDAAGADGGREGGMIPVLSDVALFRSFLAGGAPVINIAVATASICCMCSSNRCLSSC